MRKKVVESRLAKTHTIPPTLHPLQTHTILFNGLWTFVPLSYWRTGKLKVWLRNNFPEVNFAGGFLISQETLLRDNELISGPYNWTSKNRSSLRLLKKRHLPHWSFQYQNNGTKRRLNHSNKAVRKRKICIENLRGNMV